MRLVSSNENPVPLTDMIKSVQSGTEAHALAGAAVQDELVKLCHQLLDMPADQLLARLPEGSPQAETLLDQLYLWKSRMAADIATLDKARELVSAHLPSNVVPLSVVDDGKAG
jgi:hypothetical protein